MTELCHDKGALDSSGDPDMHVLRTVKGNLRTWSESKSTQGELDREKPGAGCKLATFSEWLALIYNLISKRYMVKKVNKPDKYIILY